MAEPHAIEIIKPIQHTFQLQHIENLDAILEADDIKGRHIVVISVAGANRKGKSFLLNFILKYLYAEYKRHDVSNWVSSEFPIGFKSRGGRHPQTTGVWIWSEIFTYDYADGEKVAIIIMDIQGIFDHRSSTKDNTLIFAISMMLSSVQCYNVMQNIQENDLQHLQLFADYGKLAMQTKSDTLFQNLFFIVRDWQYASENAFGDGQAVIDELLSETEDQTEENHQLRKQIKSSFEQISGFLLPYPGASVANRQYSGDINQIDQEFINQLKVLMLRLCSPENLVLKKIGGLKVRAFYSIFFSNSKVQLDAGVNPDSKYF